MKTPDVQLSEGNVVSIISNEQETLINLDPGFEMGEIFFDDLNNDKLIDVVIHISEPGYEYEAWYLQNEDHMFTHAKGVDFLDHPIFIDNNYIFQSQPIGMDGSWYSELSYFDGESITPIASITNYEGKLEFGSAQYPNPKDKSEFNRLFNGVSQTPDKRSLKDFWKQYCFENKLI